MARRRSGRKIDGILIVDKPPEWSSNDVVQRVKRLYKAQKVGHTGSLDPLATGVLPLCLGEATKFSQYLLDSDKRYWTRVALGVRTTTSDADGEVCETHDASHITAADVEAKLDNFRGEIDQIPSMYSALKHNGQPLYKLARQGIEVERKARRINIYSNELKHFEPGFVELEIHCSKGTYVRTIADELGQLLGVGAHVAQLRRLAAGPFDESQAVTLAEVAEAAENEAADALLRPVHEAVCHWPEVRLNDHTAYYLRQGQPVIVPHAPTSGWVRISEDDSETNTASGHFLGVGEILDDGRVAPRRLVAGA